MTGENLETDRLGPKSFLDKWVSFGSPERRCRFPEWASTPVEIRSVHNCDNCQTKSRFDFKGAQRSKSNVLWLSFLPKQCKKSRKKIPTNVSFCCSSGIVTPVARWPESVTVVLFTTPTFGTQKVLFDFFYPITEFFVCFSRTENRAAPNERLEQKLKMRTEKME